MFSPYDSQKTQRTRSVFLTCHYLFLLVYPTLFLGISNANFQVTLIHSVASVFLIYGYVIDVEIESSRPTPLG